MKNKALFTNLSLDAEFSDEDLQQALVDSLAQPTVSVTFKWTPGRKVRFLDVQVKYEGKWTNVLGPSTNEASGTKTIPLGNFTVGKKITLAFIVQAYTAVEKMIVLIAEEDTPLATQVAPDSGTKKLDAGDKWSEDAIVYRIVGVQAAV